MISLFVIIILQGFYINLETQISYEDNIFHYSDEHINDYKQGVNLYRYPFYSIDDAISTTKVSLKNRFKGTTLNLHLTNHHFFMNKEKSYILFNINLWRRLFNNAFVQVGLKYIPSYLIRYMYGDNSQNYVPCEYKQSIVQIRTGYNIDLFSLSGYIERQLDDYYEHFDYYDTKAWRFGLKLHLKSIYDFSPSFSYRFKSAVAKEEDPDISYREHRFRIKLSKKIIRTNFDVSYDFSRRGYTTEIDLYHKERVDTGHSLSFGFKRPVTNRIYITASYLVRMRCVSSPYVLNIDEEKDFNLNSFDLGLGVRY
ncbi:hypothetical protein KAT73_00595 [candidate division WOR-3 bacterium]|nr:hypothetical protein [candidate division WOR-3 bacterium]